MKAGSGGTARPGRGGGSRRARVSVAALPPLLPSPASWALAGVAAAAWQANAVRARGGTAPAARPKLGVRESGVPGAGLGVFAVEDIAAGEVLGRYPGRLRTSGEYVAKLETAPAASEYCWVLEGGAGVLDPTGPGGELCDPLPLLPLPLPLPLPAVDTTLARINEPGPGGDVNVDTEQAGAGLTFVAGRDLRRREELFLDYGSSYNRAGYG